MSFSNRRFAESLGVVLQRCRDKQQLLVRKVALELTMGFVQMSPVDTGRFKNNWFGQVGAKNTSTTQSTDSSGTGSLERVSAAVNAFEIGHTIFITNSLPYARPLENGHSKQAPIGMVRLTVQNYGYYLSQVAAQIKEQT